MILFKHLPLMKKGKIKEYSWIYSHSLAWLLWTVSMSFLVNPEAHHLFATSFLYTGIGLFQAAILANGYFNKSYLKYDKLYYGLQATFFLIRTSSFPSFFCLSNHCHLHRNCDDLSHWKFFLRNFISPKPRNSQLRIGICIKKF